MKSWRTFVVGIVEATFLSVGAEVLLHLTWSERGLVYGVALLRAVASALAADSRRVERVNEKVEEVKTEVQEQQ